MLLLLLTFILALLLSLYGVPLARKAALKYGIVDWPDGHLKHQREPVPYLGGMAIYLAFLISLAFTFEFRQDVLGILLAGTLMVLLGLIDDFGVLSPSTKVTGQLIAVFVLLKSGVRIDIAFLPTWISYALTVVWCLGIINAFNLLDIMDGLAAGVGVVTASILFTIALFNQDMTIAFMLVALVGSLLGFLRYNIAPARIYMGDAGSLFLGVMLAALSMVGQYAVHHPVGLLAPVFILLVPIFDTLFVVSIRMRRGLPVFLGSPDHISIRLRRWGLTVRQVVMLNWVASAVLGTLGILVMRLGSSVAVAIVGGTALALAIAGILLARLDGATVSAPSLSSAGVGPHEPRNEGT